MFDLRRYFDLGKHKTLALQCFVYNTEGDPPFWRYAALGGRAHSRGYRRARYLDKTLVATQAEYRFPVWRRLGAVVFAGVANVAPRLRVVRVRYSRPTVGAGVRYRVGGAAGLKARVDFAVGDDSFRVYASLDEAF